MNSGDGNSKCRGLGLHHQSGIIGQGVYSRGELKWFTHEGKGKPIFLQSNYHIRIIYSSKNGFAICSCLVNPSKELDQKNGLKGPKVSAIIPEAGRSIPG